MPRSGVRRWVTVATVLAALSWVGAAAADTPPRAISSDPYTNPTSQHRTQLEPDSYAWGSTIVAVFQTGRFYDGGASNIGVATSRDAGRSWGKSFLPAITVYEGGTYDRVSDPSVAYSVRYDAWLASTLPIIGTRGAGVLTSRSTDGGRTWGPPITVTTSCGFCDKNWIACDNWPTSPYYGNCYTEWDDAGGGGQLRMSTSTDGGLTWGPQRSPGNSGLGGQPLALPNGTVVVPYEGSGGIRAFRSTDGGNTWSPAVQISNISSHGVAGGLRTSPLPSAEVDAAGKVYVVWQDCRFRTGCTSNDIVMSTSTDGISWSPVERIPIDPTNSGMDHFIPGIAADPTPTLFAQRLGLAYYFYPDAACSSGSCQLHVGFISSSDGGATWSQSQTLAGPMSLSWIALTNQGRMVGDYISTSFIGGTAHPVFAVATAPVGSVYNEQAYSAAIDVVPTLTPGRPVEVEKPGQRVKQPSRRSYRPVTRQ